MSSAGSHETLRADKLLYFLRFARSRAIAKAICEAGHMRINSKRVRSAHAPVRVGDVLSIPLPSGVKVVRIETLPKRRGPASEATSLIARLDDDQVSRG